MCFAVKQGIKKKSELSGEWGWDSCSKSESNWKSLKTTVKYSAPRVVCTLADLHHFHPSLCIKTNFCVCVSVCVLCIFSTCRVFLDLRGPPAEMAPRDHGWDHTRLLLVPNKDRQSAEFRSQGAESSSAPYSHHIVTINIILCWFSLQSGADFLDLWDFLQYLISLGVGFWCVSQGLPGNIGPQGPQGPPGPAVSSPLSSSFHWNVHSITLQIVY